MEATEAVITPSPIQYTYESLDATVVNDTTDSTNAGTNNSTDASKVVASKANTKASGTKTVITNKTVFFLPLIFLLLLMYHDKKKKKK